MGVPGGYVCAGGIATAKSTPPRYLDPIWLARDRSSLLGSWIVGCEVKSDAKARERLADYLNGVHRPVRARCVSRIGWHEDAFVLPDRFHGAGPDEQVVFQTSGTFNHAYHTRG